MVVADCARPPIDKPCGEGLMPDALAALRQLGIELSVADSFPFRGIRFLDSGISVAAGFPAGCGLGVRRTILHQAMLDRAAQAGVDFIWGRRVTGLNGEGVTLDGQLVRSRWIIGADGQNSRFRRWAGLGDYRSQSRRFGFRRHYRLAPWTDSMEIYWGRDCQVYVTPVASQEVCVVLISRDPHSRLDNLLSAFPELSNRLGKSVPSSLERGAISNSRCLKKVVRGPVALIGDASGSVDAITGEGLCLSFRQAVALADALESGDLHGYQEQHRRLWRRPAFMGDLMLTLDRFPRLRHRSLRALAAKPAIFSALLAAHVDGFSSAGFFFREAVPFGWRVLTA